MELTNIEQYKINYKILDGGAIPQSFPNLENNHLVFDEHTDLFDINLFELRDEYTQKYGFALVAYDWIKILAEFIGKSKCLEVMAGTGLISKALQNCGVDIICTDNLSWENKVIYNEWKKHFTDIESLDAIEAVKKYGKDISYIIMSWPYMDDTCYRVYQAMKEINPDCMIIYIGEGDGGCTACDEFFENTQMSLRWLYSLERLESYDDEPFSKDVLSITEKLNEVFPSFYGIHDRISFVK